MFSPRIVVVCCRPGSETWAGVHEQAARKAHGTTLKTSRRFVLLSCCFAPHPVVPWPPLPVALPPHARTFALRLLPSFVWTLCPFVPRLLYLSGCFRQHAVVWQMSSSVSGTKAPGRKQVWVLFGLGQLRGGTGCTRTRSIRDSCRRSFIDIIEHGFRFQSSRRVPCVRLSVLRLPTRPATIPTLVCSGSGNESWSMFRQR